MKPRRSLRRRYFGIKETVKEEVYTLKCVPGVGFFQNSEDKEKHRYDPLEIPKRKFLQNIKNPTCV